jgi:hypothetical protein
MNNGSPSNDLALKNVHQTVKKTRSASRPKGSAEDLARESALTVGPRMCACGDVKGDLLIPKKFRRIGAVDAWVDKKEREGSVNEILQSVCDHLFV